MAFVEPPAAALTFVLEDETGSRANLSFDVPWDTLASVALAAGAVMAPLIRGISKCIVKSYSLTYTQKDTAPGVADADSRVERKGIFIFTTAVGKKVRYAVPGITNAAVTATGRIDDDNIAVLAFHSAITAVDAVFSDSNGVDLIALDQCYEAFRKSTGKMLPSERRPD